MRAAAGIADAPAHALVTLSSLAWIAAWALVLVHLGPAWWGRRIDGGSGCEEWVAPELRSAPAPRCDPAVPGLGAQR